MTDSERKLAEIVTLAEDQKTIEAEIQPEFLDSILAIVRGKK